MTRPATEAIIAFLGSEDFYGGVPGELWEVVERFSEKFALAAG